MTLYSIWCLSEKQESLISTTLDGIPIDEEEIYISQALFAVYTVISSLGILFAIGILIFNLVFAKKRFLNRYFPLFMIVILSPTPLHSVVKLSSPYLNVMIIVGAILFYVDVILFGVDGGIAHSAIASSLCMVGCYHYF